MIDREKLRAYSAAFGVGLDAAQLEKMDRYAELLTQWNEKINLTAITKPEEMVVKHFVDSLTLLSAVEPPRGARMVDVGAGAGFPSVPVKIARPDLRLTLLDSLNKRILFLRELSRELGQENDCVHARAEEAGRKADRREQYDLATARAVAHLRELSEYCLPLVKPGGRFAALKGGEIDGELAQARHAIALLGGEVESVKRLELPDQSRRSIVVIKKISQTSREYPRPSAKMAKNPLI